MLGDMRMLPLKRPLVKWTVLFLVVLVVAFYYLKGGVLVSGQVKTFTPQGSDKEMKYLSCKYLTGEGFIVKDYWSALPEKTGSCPLVVRAE